MSSLHDTAIVHVGSLLFTVSLAQQLLSLFLHISDEMVQNVECFWEQSVKVGLIAYAGRHRHSRSTQMQIPRSRSTVYLPMGTLPMARPLQPLHASNQGADMCAEPLPCLSSRLCCHFYVVVVTDLRRCPEGQ